MMMMLVIMIVAILYYNFLILEVSITAILQLARLFIYCMLVLGDYPVWRLYRNL